MEGLIVVVLLLGSAFFAGTELAVTMASRVRLRALFEAGSRTAHLAERLLRQPDRAIVVCLVGNNLMNVGISVYGREAILQLQPMSETMVDLVATLLIVPLVLLFGEILPKAVSQNYPNRVLAASAAPLLVVRVLLAPLLGLALAVAELMRLVTRKRGRILDFVSREELKQFVARSEMRGHVDAEERDLIYKIFEFWKLDPDALVRSLHSVARLPVSVRVGVAKEFMREHRLARLLLVDDSDEDVVGVVIATRLLSAPNDAPVVRYASAPRRVEPAKGLDGLLGELQREPSQVAFVRRPGKEVGVLLLDDLLDQLLGPSPLRAGATK